MVVPSTEVVVVLVFATYRAARLLAADTITLPVRERLYAWAWDEEHPVAVDGEWQPRPRAPWRTYVYELVRCQWCCGVWFAVAVYAAWRWGGDIALAVLVVLAVAGAQGFLASHTGE